MKLLKVLLITQYNEYNLQCHINLSVFRISFVAAVLLHSTSDSNAHRR